MCVVCIGAKIVLPVPILVLVLALTILDFSQY